VKGTRGVGARVEWRARLHYLLRGYRTLATNAWAGGNELDLVVRRGRSLVFCEVKGKTGLEHGDPLEMVGPEKQRRLRRAAEAWVDAHPDVADLDMSFEVVAEQAGKLERVRGAFEG
jgi:putative endonuclease